MKKDEVIEKLLLKGIKQEELVGLKVAQLKTMLNEEDVGEDSLILLDQVKESEEDIGVVKTPSKTTEIKLKVSSLDGESNSTPPALSNPPVPSDAGWTQYALSLFQDDEMDGEHPRLEGLRRIAELLLGEVLEEKCELISAPTMENNERACAKCTLIFADGKIFEALADACPSNCQKEFAMYPVAMADTRAKGRAYRTALRLKRIVAAEEIGVSTEEEKDINRNAATGQLTAIRLLSDRLGVSIKKLLNDLEISCEGKDNIPDIKLLKYSEALIVLNRLNNIRTEGIVQEKLKK